MRRKLSPSFCCHASARLRLWNSAKIIFSSRNAFGVGDRLRGSKPFPWMNDSGFWVINRMSGMTIGETIRSVSFLMTVMAIDGLVAVMLLAWLFPMSG